MQDEHNQSVETPVDLLRRSSTLTFARSLFHAAEGKELFVRELMFPSAVSVYYSLFHLGEALVLAYWSYPTPQDDPHVSPRKRIEAEFQKLRTEHQSRTSSNDSSYDVPDPAKSIGHNIVPSFLEHELPGMFQSLGKKGSRGTLRDLREFVSYGPRMVQREQTIVLFSGCQYEAEDFKRYLQQHLARIDEFFCASVRWTKEKGYKEVYERILSGDFILHEFAELRLYRPESIVKSAGTIYRSVCEREGVDLRAYRTSDSLTWHSLGEPERYGQAIQLFT